MPWDGSGTFNLTYNWENDAANGIKIRADRMDGQESDMATNGFGNCLTRDGQGKPSGNLPMNGYAHTGVANATARDQYGVVGQIQDNKYLYAAAGGTVSAITASFSPTVPALVDGMRLYVKAAGANTSTTPTFSPDGLTAHTITKFGGQALIANDIFGAGHIMELTYRSTSTLWELGNPSGGGISIGTFTPALTIGGASTGITYTAQAGYYRKFGNTIFFEIVMLLSSKGALAGNLAITNLPATSTSTTPYLPPCMVYGGSLAAGVNSLMATVNGNSTTISLYNFAAGASATLTNASITNTSQFNINGFYSI